MGREKRSLIADAPGTSLHISVNRDLAEAQASTINNRMVPIFINDEEEYLFEIAVKNYAGNKQLLICQD